MMIGQKTKNTEPKLILSGFSIFNELNAEQLEKVSLILVVETFNKGEVIIREGEKGDSLFLLLKGNVEVSKTLTLMVGRGDLDKRDKALIQLHADKAPFFGEMAILSKDSKRSATVRTLEECVIGIIKRSDLMELCEKDKEIGYIILKNMAKKLAVNLEKANQDILKLTTAFSLALQG